MKKALVLCGGIPQIELITNLKNRGYYTILADMNPNVVAWGYADKFYPVSVLDVDAIEQVAKTEKVDFVITVCADQVLQVVAEVSEHLCLPCYIDYDTAVKVSQKSNMKRVFYENRIPTSKFVITDKLDENAITGLHFPLVVKPVDSYSSRGVAKINDVADLPLAFEEAKSISRTHHAIIEEFVMGDELSIDVYVSNGKAKVLCISNLDKIPSEDKFVICRTKCPANISSVVYGRVCEISQRIANAFEIKNAPMLVQMITDGNDVSVVEFCARTGGGDKFRLIKKMTGFDVVDAVVELTIGNYPTAEGCNIENKFIINEFLYAKPEVFDHLEGFQELVEEEIISEYYQLKVKGTQIMDAKSSGDRVAYFTVEAEDEQTLFERYDKACSSIKAIGTNGNDILRHELMRI